MSPKLLPFEMNTSRCEPHLLGGLEGKAPRVVETRPRIGPNVGPGLPLLPLDGPRRLRGDVVEHPVHARHLPHDPVGNLGEELVG